jgi:hypothetical protein
MIATAIRQVFNVAAGEEAHERLDEVVERLQGPAPKVARLLEDASDELLQLPERALAEAEIRQSARARQQRDRPALRCRRIYPTTKHSSASAKHGSSVLRHVDSRTHSSTASTAECLRMFPRSR